MDMSSVVNSTVTQLSNSRAGGNTQALNVLKASLELEKHNIAQLVESVPAPAQTASNPSLGNKIDVQA